MKNVTLIMNYIYNLELQVLFDPSCVCNLGWPILRCTWGSE